MDNKFNMDKLFRSNKIESLDDFFDYTQTVNDTSKAIANNMYGVNNMMTPSPVPVSKDHYGYAFFTRPQLNLATKNLRNVRKLYSYLTQKDASVHRYIRMMLDPRLRYTENLTCPFIDNEMAFIPVLTNNLENMSGWPDIVAPTFNSPEGLRREQWGIVDGSTDIYNAFSIDCSFKNTKDEPIILMMQLWTNYQALVYEGLLSPYNDMIVENEIDYNTRIYRLILDETKTYVKKMSATGSSMPVVDPVGKFYDYQRNENYNMQNKQISLRFESFGAEYNDDILALEFNMTGGIFNSEIRNMINGKPHNLEKVPVGLLGLFNYRCYPYINLDTLELEWYVNKTHPTYKRKFEYLKQKDENKVEPSNEPTKKERQVYYTI